MYRSSFSSLFYFIFHVKEYVIMSTKDVMPKPKGPSPVTIPQQKPESIQNSKGPAPATLPKDSE